MPHKRETTKRSILIVDDVEDNRDLYAEFLAFKRYRVARARDGKDALAKVVELKPTAVLMDLSMPKMDGWEATRRIKSDPLTADTLVIIVTGHAMGDNLARARDAGADGVLVKPCLPATVFDYVEEELAKRRA